jgi:hypothetical protein
MPGREDEAELGVELTPSGSHASRSQFVYNVKTNRRPWHCAALLPDGVLGYRQSMQGKAVLGYDRIQSCDRLVRRESAAHRAMQYLPRRCDAMRVSE